MGWGGVHTSDHLSVVGSIGRYYSSTAGGERKEKEVILDGEFDN